MVYGYGDGADDGATQAKVGRDPGVSVPANVLSYLELQNNLIEMVLKEVSELENGIAPILREMAEKDPSMKEGDMDSPDISKVTRLIDQNNRQLRSITTYLRSIKSRVNL